MLVEIASITVLTSYMIDFPRLRWLRLLRGGGISWVELEGVEGGEGLESIRGQRDVVGVVGEAERGGGERAGSLEVGMLRD
ncbi:unnamed protein product [Prunus brigantina]